ncbi:MAG TPA: PEP-CTERM sorting domain-containing protein [Methylophilus sp.]|nr:PEP-CTERM sorting domain-containing protein [Methylophilus sp.]
MKLSTLALALGMAFSSSAFAASAIWNSATPWGTDTTSSFAQWSAINTTNDTTPDAGFSGATSASLRETSGNGFVTGGGLGGNIYSYTGTTTFTTTLGVAATTGLFDVYLRIGTIGEVASTTATLNGTSATSVVWNGGAVDGPFGGAAQEVYWKWEDVAASTLYTFNFAAIGPHMSLDQVALATVAVPAVTPVPEPEAFSMMALGLGLMAFVARRSSKKA